MTFLNPLVLRGYFPWNSRAIEEKANDSDFDWLNRFAKGLELLDDYDHERLDRKGLTQRETIYPEKEDYQMMIDAMRADFKSAVFGKERDGSFQSAVAQISKGFGNEDFYPSIEEKASLPVSRKKWTP